MHNSLEKHVKGIERKPGSNLIHQKAHTMANIIIENGLTDVSEVWGSEVSLYYPELYAGTTDLVGVYKDAPAIMDFKQARKLKKKEWVEDYYLQLVAYAEAHNKMYDTQIDKGRIFICTQNNQLIQIITINGEVSGMQNWNNTTSLFSNKYCVCLQ